MKPTHNLMETTLNYNFVVRVWSIKAKKVENHPHDTKASAEIFRKQCRPTEYSNVALYPKALFIKLFGPLEQPKA